jgi:hypothetical protein
MTAAPAPATAEAASASASATRRRPADGVRVRVFGVRHHGPGSARAVLRALDADPPDVVLLEGPADSDPILPLAGHADMAAPVALLGYVKDRPERAVFFPFASFSPEWVALRWALDHGVPVRCIDLPVRTMLAPRAADHHDTASLFDTPVARPLDPLRELADAAGYDDPERWWEDAVEQRRLGGTGDAGGSVDPDAGFRAVAAAMSELRVRFEPDGVPRDGEEQRREAHMRAGIRAAVTAGHRHLVVVCGAWHVPALDDALDPAQARRDTATLRGLPKIAATVTWVPWTHRRLASATGYRAGVTAPGWYHHLHRHAGPDVIAEWFVRVARVLRAADHAASPADVVEATRLATTLAALRDRPLAGLSEVDDAARAVFGQGHDTPMRLISHELVIGAELGHVPDSTPMVPLARSIAAAQQAARLKPAVAAATVELDLRQSLHLQRSHLLRRMLLLDIPWGAPMEGRGNAGTFRETWAVQWDPEYEVRIIEASPLGTTLPTACRAAVAQRIADSTRLGDLTVLLEQVLLAGLDDAVADLLAAIADLAALATEAARLLDAVPPLSRTIRYGDVRGTEAVDLGEVVRGLVGRAAAGLATACSGIDDDTSTAMAGSIQAAHAALLLLDDHELVDTLRRAAEPVVELDGVHGVIRGTVLRMLADAGTIDTDEVERRVSRQLSSGVEAVAAASFVEGFLAETGAVLVHDDVLLRVLDRWMASLDDDQFVAALPLLRRTFGGFEAAERRAIGERLRTGAMPPPTRPVHRLDPARVERGLYTLELLLGVEP